MGMSRSHTRTALRCSLLVLFLLPLASCDSLFGHKAKPVRHAHAAKTYTAEIYTTHLALARLELPASAGDTSAADTDLDILQAYNTKPAKTRKKAKAPKPEQQTVMIVSYKTSDDSTLQQIAVPAGKSQQTKDFPALAEVMAKLGSTGGTLHNLMLSTITVAPDETLKLPDGTADEARQMIAQMQQRLMETAQPPAPLDDARGQLKLARFFMTHRFRDAAYLAVDNVKRQLAVITRSQPDDAEAIQTLSKELETLEGELHKALPFTLSAQ